MEKKRIDLIQAMLDQVKEEVDYQDDGGEICLYAYKLTTKVLVKMVGTDLVDGT